MLINETEWPAMVAGRRSYGRCRLNGNETTPQAAFTTRRADKKCNEYKRCVVGTYIASEPLNKPKTSGGLMRSPSKSMMPRKAVTICTLLMGLTITAGWAATKATDKVSFSESYADKTGCTGSESDGSLSCDAYPTGKFSLTAAVSFNSSNYVDFTTLGDSTAVSIDIGNWSLENRYADGGTLGDANPLKFKSTKKQGTNGVTATFVLMDNVATDADCDTAPKKEGLVTLTITETKLTVTVSATTGDDNVSCADALEASPDASSFDGNETAPITDEAVTVSISVGDSFGMSTDVICNGSVTTTEPTLGDGSTPDVSKINLSGTGSF